MVFYRVRFIIWQLPCFYDTDSIDVRLEDGRGRCAGRLEVKYEGTWQRVHEQDWTEANSNTVCSQLACGGARATSQKWFPQGSAAFFSKKVGCPPKAGHIAECGTSTWDAPPVGQSAVMLVCEGGCSPSLPALNVSSLSNKPVFC